MEKLSMTSPDLTEYNIEKLAELFPTVVTESVDADGNVKKIIDFDLLRQELSDHVVEGPQERYRLDWPGKRAAAFAANAPIAKTMRPVREESVEFDTTRNLFIEGDNLDALKLLQEMGAQYGQGFLFRKPVPIGDTVQSATARLVRARAAGAAEREASVYAGGACGALVNTHPT